MKYLAASILFLLMSSCFPIKIAPNLEAGKIIKAKNFKRQLPKQYAYIFDDPKKANEFYKYINAKFQIDYDDIDGNIPVSIGSQTYYLTSYEIEKNTEVVNLVPMMVSAILEEKGLGSGDHDIDVSRTGTWYIALTLTDNDLKDALNPDYQYLNETSAFVQHMKDEYLSTVHYIEIFLKAK